MKVELFYFDGCPNHERVLPRVRELVADIDPSAEIELVRVESVEDAERKHFLGSPTIRVNGRDIDPGASERDDFGLKCRLYAVNATLSGVPPEEWIRRSLAESKC